jgi:predicted nucleic acid-binding protein
VLDATEGAAAPDLLNAEVLHVLGRYERQRLIDAHRSRLALDALIDLPVTRYPTLALLDRAWTLRPNLSGYDAMYVALADALGVAIITTDKRLAAAARRHARVPVVLLS